MLTVLGAEGDPEARLAEVVYTEVVLDDAGILGPEESEAVVLEAGQVEDGASVDYSPAEHMVGLGPLPVMHHLHRVPHPQHLQHRPLQASSTEEPTSSLLHTHSTRPRCASYRSSAPQFL